MKWLLHLLWKCLPHEHDYRAVIVGRAMECRCVYCGRLYDWEKRFPRLRD